MTRLEPPLREIPVEGNLNGRTPFPEATKVILETLAAKDCPYTVSSLESKTGINRKTIDKALELLVELQRLSEGHHLEIDKMKRIKVIRFRKEGFLALPEAAQMRILRTEYFPKPSEEDMILIHLYSKGATTEKSSINLKTTPILRKLVKQGQIMRKQGKFYLSDEGCIVARGAMKLYPEVK
jgi:hypothetical protein